MHPYIMKKKFLLVGVVTEIDLASDFSRMLEDLRQRLKQDHENISNKKFPVRMVGIWSPYADNRARINKPKLLYFAGVEVLRIDNAPGNFIVKDLPESYFAVFREKTRGAASKYAYTEWLPTSRYTINENILGDFEIFDDMERYGAADECDILLPIRARHEVG